MEVARWLTMAHPGDPSLAPRTESRSKQPSQVASWTEMYGMAGECSKTQVENIKNIWREGNGTIMNLTF